MNTQQKGTMAELLACQWLMQNGYEAFRNVCPVGPVDVIAFDKITEEIILIDVKTASKRKNSSGDIVWNAGSSKTPEQIKIGVEFLYYIPASREFLWEHDLKNPEPKIIHKKILIPKYIDSLTAEELEERLKEQMMQPIE